MNISETIQDLCTITAASNRKCNVAYWFVPSTVILNDLQGHFIILS